MAAPLPTGFNVQAQLLAPQVDPTLFAPDALKQLQIAHSGMLVGQELANLENQRAERELTAAKIEADKKLNDYNMKLIEDASKRLPFEHQKQLALIEQQRAAAQLGAATAGAQLTAGLPFKNAQVLGANADLSLRGTTALLNSRVPELSAQVAEQDTQNKLSSAESAADFSSLSPEAQTQALAAAKALGSWGVTLDGSGREMVNPDFIAIQNKSEIDPDTGNTRTWSEAVDKTTGKVVWKQDERVTHAGSEMKSTTTATREVTSLMQSLNLASQLDSALAKYQQKNAGGVGQALASNLANRPATGLMSVGAKALGAKLQSEDTVQIVQQIQSFKNTIAHQLFGSALTKEESANVEGMLPTASDISDPARARSKLREAAGYLQAKLKPYQDRGITSRAGFAAPPSLSSVATPQLSPVARVLQEGGIIKFKGVPHRVTTGPDGRKFLMPVQ